MSLEPSVHSPYCDISSFLPIKVYKLDFKRQPVAQFWSGTEASRSPGTLVNGVVDDLYH